MLAKVSQIGIPLFQYTDFQFGRITAGTYRTSASTLATAASNVLRFEDIGDGNGANALFEGFWQQYSQQTENLTGWTNNTGATTTGNTTIAPDGNLTADTINLAASTASRIQITWGAVAAANNIVCQSAWVLQGTSPNTTYVGFIDANASFHIVTATGTGTWQRFDVNGTVGTASTPGTQIFQNPVSTAHQVVVWGVQMNFGMYPKSYFPNLGGGAPGLNYEDCLMGIPAQVPYQWRSGRWQVPFYPEWALTELQPAEERWLCGFGINGSGVRFRNDGNGVNLEALVNGVIVAANNAVPVFARNAKLIITCDAAQGQVGVGASFGPAGSAFSFPANVPVRVGGVPGDYNSANVYTAADGRFGTWVTA